jgi:hypothetical protein
MATLFGDRATLAFEVGDPSPESAALRSVDHWAAGRWLTCDDNTVFVPQFCMSLESSLRWLNAAPDGVVEARGFMAWGPTTDNVQTLLTMRGAQCELTFEFWRAEHTPADEIGVPFRVTLPTEALIARIEGVLSALREGI